MVGIQILSVNEEVGKVCFTEFDIVLINGRRVEKGDSIGISETYQVIVAMQYGSVDIFMGGETVSLGVTDELMVLLLILPDTHRGADP
jgi:hypothetical protein